MTCDQQKVFIGAIPAVPRTNRLTGFIYPPQEFLAVFIVHFDENGRLVLCYGFRKPSQNAHLHPFHINLQEGGRHFKQKIIPSRHPKASLPFHHSTTAKIMVWRINQEPFGGFV